KHMSETLVAVQILGGLLTPVIAGLAIWIAYQQHRTARDKLKLDLFDRRFKVYRGVMDFLGEVNKDAKPTREAFSAFYRETDPTRFLFEGEVRDFIEVIRVKAADLRRAVATVAEACADQCQTIPHEQLLQATAVEKDLIVWFFKQGEVAGQVFQPY